MEEADIEESFVNDFCSVLVRTAWRHVRWISIAITNDAESKA